MMSLSTIRSMSAAQARKSAAQGRLPLLVEADDMVNDDVLRRHIKFIPNLGDRNPKGYRFIEELFVDASGFGREDEPALTQQGFMAKVRALGPGHYYSISEVGQFQVRIRVFRRTSGEN